MRNRSKKKKKLKERIADTSVSKTGVLDDPSISLGSDAAEASDDSLFLSLKWVTRDLIGVVVVIVVIAATLTAVKVADSKTHFLDDLSTKVFRASGL
jgi:hypothetical protein